MKVEARNVHIVDCLSDIQGRQKHSQTLGVLRLNTCSAVEFVEEMQVVAPKILHQWAITPRCATRNKRRLTFELTGARRQEQ
jgi:hypothetical protein